jgi:Bacterial Ig domain
MPCRRRLLVLSSRRVISLLGVFALATGAGVLGSAVPAAATTVQPVSGVSLNAIACMNPTTCVAVGSLPSHHGSAVVPITNGVPGTVEPEGDIIGLNGVACPTATECFAVGQTTAVGPGASGLEGTVLTIPGGTENLVPETSNLEAVSCIATTAHCVAIGADVNGGPVVVYIDNGVPDEPIRYGAFLGLQLGGIACPSDTTCYIVGEDTQSSEGFLEPIDPQTQEIGAEQLVSGSTSLDNIFCSSTTACIAVGMVGTYPSSTGVVVPITNGTPGTAETASGTNRLPGVACPSATLCEGVGQNAAGTYGAVVPITNGEVGATFQLSGAAVVFLSGIACPSASSCEAIGVQTTTGYIVLPMTSPTTTVALPSNGATLAGSHYLDAAASDNLGLTQVNYVLSGGTYNNTVISGSTPTYFGWIGSWDTTTVPNGTYTLQSVATDVEGFSTTSAPITITVNNQPPTTAVLLPSNGATLTGAQYLDAAASSPAGIKSVSFEITGGTLNNQVISGSTATYFGWIGGWDTTTVPNGTYTLQSIATDVDGVSTTSAPITITVNNSPPTTAVLVPSNGTTQSGGAAILDASASASVTSVSFELTGGTLNNQVISTSTHTYFGWIGQWDTTTVPDGTYTLQSVASYAGGVSGTSPGIMITVDN